jgi:hypothetical protein
VGRKVAKEKVAKEKVVAVLDAGGVCVELILDLA